jgi:hypothetical protein
MREESIAEALALAGPLHQAGNVRHVKEGWNLQKIARITGRVFTVMSVTLMKAEPLLIARSNRHVWSNRHVLTSTLVKLKG